LAWGAQGISGWRLWHQHLDLGGRASPKPGAPAKSYGPYYQWTFKEAGKTITVNLTAAQAESFGSAIDRHRLLEETVAEMRTLSRQILEAEMPGVKRRKP
jgi:hypothetical protein